MITIDAERCTGCGACVEVCPTAALFLVEGKATVDKALCRDCESCLAACPSGAIAHPVPSPAVQDTRLPALRPEPEIIRVKTQPAPGPARSELLLAMSAALAWAGREILPWLAGVLLETVDRQTTRLSTKGAARSRATPASGAKGGGRQHRHRRRGGSG